MAQKINQKQFGTTYSTTEQLTGDVWIDGKPIYKKVVSFGSLPNNTVKNVPHGISNMDRCVRFVGIGKSASGDTHYMLSPMVSSVSGTVLAGSTITATDISIRTTTDLTTTLGSSYFIIEYTKV